MSKDIRAGNFRIRDNRKLVINIIEETFEADNLESALETLVKSLTSIYPGSKIWIAEKYGKRKSYIAGSGNETYQPAEKLSITDDYYLFLQDFSEMNKRERELARSIFKLVIIFYED